MRPYRESRVPQAPLQPLHSAKQNSFHPLVRYIRGGNDGTRFPYTLPAAQNLARFDDLSPLLCTFCQPPIPLNVTSSSHECLEVQVGRLAVLRSVQSELLLLVIGAHARAAQHALEATHH